MKIIYRWIAAVLAGVLRAVLWVGKRWVSESTRLDIANALEAYREKVHG